MEILLEQGKKLCLEGRYDEAIAVFGRIPASSPLIGRARFELGKAYLGQGKRPEAREAFLASLALDPSNMHARVLLAKVYKEAGETEKAIGEFTRLLDAGYAEENIARELFSIYLEAGRFDEARRALDQAKGRGHEGRAFEEDLARLTAGQIRNIQRLSFEGRYKDAAKESEKALAFLPAGDLMRRNCVLNEAEIAAKKTVLDSKMRSLTFTLTNRCNLRCLMCETRKTPWDLPETIKKEIAGLFPYIERVMWQGGEAFLYGGFEELLDEASKYPIRQVIATNGMLITDAMAEKLVKYNVELTFSIDGATKEVYEHIRPGATFEKVIGRVRLINELREKHNPGMRTRLNVLIMRANYRQIEQFIDFAAEHRFTTLFFNSAGCDFKNLQENVFYYNHDDEIMAYLNSVRGKIAEKAALLGITLENWLPTEDFFKEASGEKPAENKRPAPAPSPARVPEPAERKLFCHAPWQRLYIDCGGNVRPDCLCLVDHFIGNLKKSPLAELWNGEEIVKYREKIIAGDIKPLCNPDCVYGRVPEKNLKYI